MSIGSYPRVTVQGTGNAQNPSNGYGLMIFNPATSKYEAANSATFTGGDPATETTLNSILTTLSQVLTKLTSIDASTTSINTSTTSIDSDLASVLANQTNGNARVVLRDTSGNLVGVDSGTSALKVANQA